MEDLTGKLVDRYQILELLGKGGMAMVYKAYDTRLEREVAVKIIRLEAFPPEELHDVLKRFEREAKALARLSHPNIVKVMDYGEYEGSPFLVLEYLPGGTLKHRIGESMLWQEAMRLLLPVARGLEYAHQRGIVHRDIKPANILLTENGEPTLSDFGIAKLLQGEKATTLTGSGAAVGTPEYMAPEQWTGGTSAKSDMYSLGVVLYEIITGQRPYVADTPGGVFLKQVTEPLPVPRDMVPDLPDAVERFLLKVLAKEPSERYDDFGAFVRELESLLTEHSYQVRSEELEAGKLDKDPKADTDRALAKEILPNPVPTVSIQSASVLPRPDRRRGIAAVVGVVVIVALIVGIPKIQGMLSTSPAPTNGNAESQFSPSAIAVSTSSQTAIPEAETPVLIVTQTQVVTASPASLQIEITDDFGVEMALVPAGEFAMGSDKNGPDDIPYHKVDLDAFYIDRYEVTNARYAECVEKGPCTQPLQTASSNPKKYYGDPNFDNYPVNYVSWQMSKTYCEWRGAGLPTEAQWEKAARGGLERKQSPWGDETYNCSPGANNGASFYSCTNDVQPVGLYGPNGYGLYDMVGNVWEWVSDWFSDRAYFEGLPSPVINPLGPDMGYYRVLRGGSSVSYYPLLANRRKGEPESVDNFVGFRCVHDVPSTQVSTPASGSTADENSSALSTEIPEGLGVGSTKISEKDGMVMVYVPAGEFEMGGDIDEAHADCQKFEYDCRRDYFVDQEPIHNVYLDTFWIDQMEVTNFMYTKCVEAGQCNPPKEGWSSGREKYYENPEFDNFPVVFVSWFDASSYCEWAERRLPTEAEWEKAASWDSEKQIKNIYPWGDGADCSFANINDCSGNTTAVGSYIADQSFYGAKDMAGNVIEWVEDWYGSAYYALSPSSNPLGPASGTYRVVRGGSFYGNNGGNVRTTKRGGREPYYVYFDSGFRCARDVTP